MARAWLAGIRKGGIFAIPRRKSLGPPRKMPLGVRRKIAVAVHRKLRSIGCG